MSCVALQEGPLSSSEEFYDFRRKAAEIVEDIIFVVGPINVFQHLAKQFTDESSWEAKESCLFLLYHVSRSIDP